MEHAIDLKKVSNIAFDGIDHSDAPDYCDAHIVSADYDGEPMSSDNIADLNDNRDFVYESLMKHLY